MLEEIDAAVAVAPLVVVPADQLEEPLVQADARARVEDAGGWAVDEVGRDHFILGVFQDVLEVGLGGLFHGGADLLVGGFFDGLDGEVDDADGGSGDAEGHAGQFSLDLGADEPDGFGGAGGGGDDVDGGGAATFPVLAGGAVDRLLRGRVAVDGGHEAFLDPETFLEEDVDDGGETVGGAGGVGDDVVFGGVVFGVVDAHDDGDVLAFGGGGDDDLFAAGGDVALGFVGFGEKAGGFDDEVDPQVFPRKGGGAFLDGEAFDFVAVDDEDVVFRDRRGGFFAADFALVAALDGVVLDQVGEVVGGNEVVHRHHVEFFTEQALLAERPEDQSADPAESINRDFVFGSHRFKQKNVAN